MKKTLNGWQVTLLVVAFMAACFAVIFGVGWLLSKASWVAKLDAVEGIAAWLWLALYGVHVILSAVKWMKKRPVIGTIDLIFQLAAFVCLTAKLSISAAFKFAGID